MTSKPDRTLSRPPTSRRPSPVRGREGNEPFTRAFSRITSIIRGKHESRPEGAKRPPFLRSYLCIISISRGKSEGRPEGAKRPTAGDEPREFTSRGEGGRVPPFFEKLPFPSPRPFSARRQRLVNEIMAGNDPDRLLGGGACRGTCPAAGAALFRDRRGLGGAP